MDLKNRSDLKNKRKLERVKKNIFPENTKRGVLDVETPIIRMKK